MHMNKKVIGGLAIVALGVLVFAPGQLSTALPLLLVIACPLSMVFMMRGMSGARATTGNGSCSKATAGTDEATTSTATQPGAPLAATSTDNSEVELLRAEVDRLRAEVRYRKHERSL